ncbi:MAG: GatB/YqeY domain-containing protein [Patescibacteria group bacterium]|nr:GatB/YqeY domain-containing protein [Patescibacteria group bacterium]MDE1946006.1 GatB/YqeY domain-containing protein [Patescibacteria group bacterium]
MTIHAQIKAGIKESMIKKDEVRLTTLRGVQAAFVNELIAKKINGDEMPDEDAIAVIRRLVKQRKDSIEQFEKGGRADLAKSEEAEMKILEAFLPAQMGKEEIVKVVEAAKARAGTIDKAKMGQFMGGIMKDLKGKADGALVKQVVEEIVGK